MQRKGRINPRVIGIIVTVLAISVIVVLQLTGTINLIKSQRDFCPGIGDRVLCGICNKDIKLSDNPYAGQCRMCPSGTSCSGDVCGEIKCTPGGPTITPVELKDIPYITKEGEELVAINAFPGYVYIFTENITQEEAKNIIESSGGKVYRSLPHSEVFLVMVESGKEATFLQEIYKYDWVKDAIPVSPPAKGTVRVSDFFSNPSTFDTKYRWDCDSDHGNIVERLASRYIPEMETFDLPPQIETDPAYIVDLLQNIGERMEKARDECGYVVFSLSLQSGESANMTSVPHGGCKTKECKQVRKSQKLFYSLFLDLFRAAKKDDQALADHSMIVIIAGNAGVDLDNEISKLRKEYKDVFNYMTIVGSIRSGDPNQISIDYNHLKVNSLPKGTIHPSMVYAIGDSIPVYDSSGGKKLRCQGTSFAAPQVAAVMEYIWRRAPALISSQVIESFDQALLEMGNETRIPQKIPEDDENDIYIDTAFIERAVKIAKQKGPGSLGGTWEGNFISHSVSQEGWTCITDVSTPIKICMAQKCQNVTGVITFPEGLNGKTTSPEEGAFCPPGIACSGGPGGQCSEFTGTLSNDNIKLSLLTLNGGSYVYNPLTPQEKAQSSASVSGNTTNFYFSSSGSSGAQSLSQTVGSFTAKKISDRCE
ncbi:MAG TPA: hypothetical protein VJI46_03485 [Candidatus Nanoarchaeia archaeon]|nr:hypothetical protein [Candidatus Nanoarchaeia archaeon]